MTEERNTYTIDPPAVSPEALADRITQLERRFDAERGRVAAEMGFQSTAIDALTKRIDSWVPLLAAIAATIQSRSAQVAAQTALDARRGMQNDIGPAGWEAGND